jgi:hypothetical protein
MIIAYGSAMTTRTMPTSFSIPDDVRRRAGSRAANDGLSLASAVRLLLAGYASGRIAIAAVGADTITVEKVEVIPMGASTRKLAARAFAAVKKHGHR